MAIYHLEAKMVSRGAGRSAVAAAAYLSCSRLLNEYDGVQHDYTRKQGLVWQQVFLPVAAPTEWQNREILWNAVEENEKTKDSRLAREFVVALPIELSKAQWERLLSDFVSDTFVSDGMCADVAIHDPYPPGHNPHAHILLTVRPLNEKGKWQYKTEKEYLCVKNGKEQGFTAAEFKQAQADGWEKQYQYKVGKKKVYMVPSSAQAQGYERVSKYPKSTKYGRQNPISERWNSEEQLVFWRKAWADVTNLHLERAGQEERIDQRSHVERGLDEQPTIHEGVTARALEKKGIVSDRCELNRQIKADNALLRELKAAVKKLMQVVKVAVPALAEAMEFLRANMIVFRYQIRYAGLGKHKLSERLNVLKPTLERYTLLVQQIKNKAKERKTLLAEKKATPFYQFVVHNDLEKKIAKLTEDLEELKSEKVMVLSSLGCDEDTGIAEVRKSVAAMERNLERLTQQEEKYVAELDTALIQFTELKEQEKEVDYIALFEQRAVLRPDTIQAVTSKLKMAYGEKFAPIILADSKRDVAELLGEETEVRSIHEDLQKKHEQEVECKNTPKKNGQER
ncbi:MobQ family relaxase [Butyricicoccus pullicaecorum]|uniref:Mobilization protein n=1 Tax=Butyricicoccus pullicaecorum TaxID=501571 RepID=A0A1Y4LPX2_9FIRM|nr:MobQ family relaxase [Butyricicoccus pullicaecorum]OUP57001.1 mobilization protein [Butyricicoccus pullicaecorum]